MQKILLNFFKKYYNKFFIKNINNFFLLSFLFKIYLNNYGILNYKINKKIWNYLYVKYF